MNINELLKGKEDCLCGKEHHCDVKHVYIDNGAVKNIVNHVKDYQHIVLVADQNTYKVAGEEVEELLESHSITTLIYETGNEFLVPDEDALEALESLCNECDADLIIGIGSGVINDICKYVSFKLNLKYYIIATAPSMDGYASDGAALILNDMKITLSSHVPEVIIGDVNYLKTAPIEMIQSGYGDIIGKYSALNDWKLSSVVNDEYMCDYVYNLTFDMVKKTESITDEVMSRSDKSIKILMEALVVVGIAMSYMKNSRPASGSEHHLSHFFEIVGLLNKESYFNHGVDVVYSTVITQMLREDILKLEGFEETVKYNEDEYKNDIHRIYTDAAKGIIDLQNKAGWYQKDYISIYKEKYNEIINVLKEVPSSHYFIELLEKVDLPMHKFYDLYGEDKIRDAVFYGKDLKVRYTVLWLYYTLFFNKNKQ